MPTQKEVDLVQADWIKVLKISSVAATLFYDRLFTLDPQLRALFPADLSEQKLKLMQMLGVVVQGLSTWSEIEPAVEAMGRRHVAYGTKPEHYATVGAALLWAIRQGVGPAFDEEHAAAWASVYELIASTMIDASERVAATA